MLKQYLRHLYEDFMRLSDATNEGSITAGQTLIKVMNRGNSDTCSLNMFDIEIWLKLLPILIFFLIFILLFNLVNNLNPFERAKLILICLLEIDFKLTKSFNLVSFLVYFYLVYFMIFKSILSTNIKTNSVIVNTSAIIDNQNDLLNTKK